MPDYKTLYLTLFRAVTEAVEILQAAQQKTEALYVESKEPLIIPQRTVAPVSAPTENKEPRLDCAD